MSRTPLFSLITRSMRLAHASRHRAEPLDEVIARAIEAPRAGSITRRRFVSQTAAASAALALAACLPRRAGSARNTPRRDGPPVLIIGAGIAGLTAAYRLRQQGVPVRVIEAQNRVGGRMYSLRGAFPDAQVCELGGELIDTKHERIQALAAELGIALDDLRTEPEGIASDRWFFGGSRRSGAEVIAALAPVAERLAAERRALGDGIDPTYRETGGAEALDRMTIAEWLDRTGVSGWVRELLDVGYTTEYGMPLDRQSALNFITMISVDDSSFEIFGESDERFHVHDGNDRIPLTLAERLDGAIETGTVLEAVSARGDGGFTCTLRRGATSLTASASHLLLAIPFTTLRDVHLDVPLPDPKRRSIRELGYGANAKLMVGFSERVWRTRHGSNGSVLTSLPFQLTWEASRGQAGRSGILTNFTGGAHALELARGTAEDQARSLVADLEHVFPGTTAAARAGAVRFNWPSFPWTRGSYAGYLPGQWTSLRGAEGERVGRLFFAGEHCSLDAQGFMEGGCETGERAADEILASLGQAVVRPSAARGEPIRLRA